MLWPSSIPLHAQIARQLDSAARRAFRCPLTFTGQDGSRCLPVATITSSCSHSIFRRAQLAGRAGRKHHHPHNTMAVLPQSLASCCPRSGRDHSISPRACPREHFSETDQGRQFECHRMAFPVEADRIPKLLAKRISRLELELEPWYQDWHFRSRDGLQRAFSRTMDGL